MVAELQEEVNTIFCDICAPDSPFLDFSDKSLQEKSKILKTFTEKAKQTGLKGVLKMAIESATQKTLNPNLVKSALSVFLTHNAEARRLGVVVPPLALQSKFKAFARPTAKPYPVTPDTLRGPEVLAYWREDYDLNDHHNHWHDVFPTIGVDGKRVIKRQGELFLYMHSQMLARYNAELHAWDMDPVHPFDYDETVFFGYTPPPGLLREYAPRPANRGWFVNNNPAIPDNPIPSKSEMKRTRDNILRDIGLDKLRTVDANGASGEYQLTEENAMNTVGFVVEALTSDLQEVSDGVRTDRDEYGSVHNNGHNKFAEIGAQSIDRLGVMGSVAAAVRDHIFWRWHRHVDNFRREIGLKYTHDLGTFKPDADITDLQIVPRNPNSTTPAGGLATYMCPPNVELNEVNAKLRHEPYEWRVTVRSTLDTAPTEACPQCFTVRLFMVPAVWIEDRNAWIEMDKFTVSLTQREDTITQKDGESAVARKVRPYSSNSRCSCGWPQNMMLPVGKPDGLSYITFAMLTEDELGQVRN